jgi:uncharacterized protein with von Willebrand factor type A (vWA) domain
MKKMHYLLIFDFSMSMADYEQELKKQLTKHFKNIFRQDGGKFKLTCHLGLFNDHMLFIQKVNQCQEIEKLLNLVHCRGGTAFYDAIGKGFEYLQNQMNADKKLMIIFSDGYENKSMLSSQLEIQNLQASKQIEIILVGGGWNIDLPFEKYPFYNLIIKEKNQVDINQMFSVITGIFHLKYAFLD